MVWNVVPSYSIPLHWGCWHTDQHSCHKDFVDLQTSESTAYMCQTCLHLPGKPFSPYLTSDALGELGACGLFRGALRAFCLREVTGISWVLSVTSRLMATSLAWALSEAMLTDSTLGRDIFI